MSTDENSVPTDEVSSATAASGWRVLLLVATVVGLLLAVVVGTLIFLFRDNLPPLTAADFEAAMARWESRKPANYDLKLELGGARPGVFEVEVRDGRVRTAPRLNGRPVRAQHTWQTWSVDGQFETIQRELELADDPTTEMGATADTQIVLRAKFDPEFGYPSQFRRTVLGSGPEISWRVTRFAPLP